ncbi:UNVERIFIED_CONTAM: hypothetical protein PYX00_003705 [Menopon gallinae]|uniref:Uncharacterized protein n=1 Tax=Menopon gallinae TaxID=328185 RepID=A0AAW2I0Z7_9NEOP
MPFIDEDLLWSPEAENKIDNLNLNQCLETTNQQQEPPELSQSDLTGLVSSLESSLSEVDVELFNQLGCSLELDTFLTDLAGVEVKEENNNDIVADVSSTTTINNKNILTPQQALNELRQRNAKFNIAAANPLLAGKVAAALMAAIVTLPSSSILILLDDLRRRPSSFAILGPLAATSTFPSPESRPIRRLPPSFFSKRLPSRR